MIDGVAGLNVVILSAATFIVALLVSAVGPTGGAQLAAVSATMPPQLVIPIHAWISGLSALFRALTLRRHIDWRYVGRFVPASALGALAVTLVYTRVEWSRVQLLVALYILVVSVSEIVGLKFRAGFKRSRPAADGLITGLLSMVIGASGPLLMALMQHHESDRKRLVGTFSAALTFQHLSKLVAFGAIGVSVMQYPRLLAIITLCAAAGTWTGSAILVRIGETVYRRALAWLLALTSIWLILNSL